MAVAGITSLPRWGSMTTQKETAIPISRDYQILVYSPRFRAALAVTLEYADNSYWIAIHPEVVAHGIGNSREEAVIDLVEVITALYDELRESEDVLAPHLLKELNYLRSIFHD